MPHHRSESPATYSAFISYRHVPRDTAWAKWLLEALETYRTPKALQKTGVPARLKKLFRDEDEIPASADLTDQITQALEASEYLIVVCSSDTPQSLWVDKEIETFHTLGRSARVLALLVEGEPDDAFPKLLMRELDHVDNEGKIHWKAELREPIAADVRPRAGTSDKVLKQNALLRIAATLLGVRFDDLRQRDLQRKRLRQRSLAVAACLTLLLTGLGGFLWWDNTRLKTADYASYVTRHMLPQGVSPLDASQSAARAYRYRIETRGGKVRRLRTLSSTDRPTNDFRTEKISTWSYFYRDDLLESARLTDRNGALVRIEQYEISEDGHEVVVVFRAGNGRAYAQNAATAQLRVINNNTKAGQTTITQNRLELDDAGLILRRQFEDFYGTPRADASGIYGKSYVHDARGLVIGEQFLDAAQAPAAQRNGLAQLRYGHSDMGELTDVVSLDLEGQPVVGDSGHARARYLRDSWGNYAGGRYFGPDDAPIITVQGFAGQDLDIDARGRAIREVRYDESGAVALGTQDDIAIMTYRYDSQGNQVERNIFDSAGQPALSRQGYATLRSTYDDQGRVVAIDFLGLTGEPVLNHEGVARVESDFDAESRIIENRFFGSDGKPIRRKNFAARETYTFDVAGNLVMTEFFDIDGSRQRVSDGNAIRRSTYDGRGNITRSSFFDEDGAPTSGKQGYATLALTYDQQGRMIRQDHLGPDDGLVFNSSGFARFEQDYDAKGNKVQQRYFDHLGRLHLKGNTYAAVGYRYDAQGNMTEQIFLDANLQPGASKTGVQTMRQTFDGQGRVLKAAQYGADGALIADDNGVAIYENSFDRAGRQTSVRYFDASGARVMTTKGYSRSDTVYDAKGNIVAQRRYDTRDALTMTPDGFAQLTNTYDARGALLGTRYMDPDGALVVASKGFASFTNKNDARGNLLEQAYFDRNSAPVPNNDGFARQRNRFDAAGRRTLQEYFGADGAPVLNRQGRASLQSSYDTFANVLSEASFGVQGEPVVTSRGFHKLLITRDALGRNIREEYIGIDGAAVTGKNGLTALERRYDVAGNIIEFTQWKWDTAKGAQTIFLRAEFTYDALNNVVDERGYDAEGRAIAGASGYHRNTNAYDSYGRVQRRAYFDAQGDPVRSNQGYAAVETSYTPLGSVAEVRRFGMDGALTINGTGAAIERFDTNALGHVTNRSYLSADKRPILAGTDPLAHARVEADYDARGQWIERRYFGISDDGATADILLLTATRTLDAMGHTTLLRIVDPQGAPLGSDPHATALRYDAFGRAIEIRGLDGQENPALLRNGAAIQRSTYDARGNLTATDFFDAMGDPMISLDGFARRTYVLDARGNVLETATFDTQGALLALASGFARQVRVYNALDQIVERTYFDAENRQVAFKGGFDRYLFTYDISGKMLTRRKLSRKTPHHLVEYYDAAGRVTVTEWQDAQGKVVDVAGQFTRIANTYDARGNRIGIATFDASGAPVSGAKGYASQTTNYTPRGQVETRRFFDIAGAPVVTTDGYAGLKFKYDAKGRPVQNVYLGPDGKPMNGPNGYAEYHSTYDAQGELALQVYYDVSGSYVGTYSIYAQRLKDAFDAKDAALIGTLLAESIAQLTDNGVLTQGPSDKRAGLYVNAAWYALFARDPEQAETLAREGLKLSPDNLPLQTNLAHALMFQNRTSEAKALYLIHRGKQLSGRGSWNDVIIADFATLQDHGQSHPMMTEITALLRAQVPLPNDLETDN